MAPRLLTTANFDRDGIADLASAQESNPDRGVVAVSLGNGDGTFNEGEAFTADYYPTYVIAEDLNDDNYPDLAVANREAFDQEGSPRKVSVLLNIPPPGATTSTSGPSGTAGDPRPSFQLASSETNPNLAGSSASAAGSTTRISVDPSGGQLKTSSSGGASISSDGRYVVFTSTSTNLVSGDTNVSPDVFVRDRTTGTTQRVSVPSSGTQSHLGGGSSISSDGRFAVFSSQSLDLVADDTNGFTDVFLRELGDAPPQQGDCMGPTTTASASTASGAAYAPGTWIKEDVEVSLSAQDNEGGSGVKEIAYSVNGGANQIYNPTNKIPINTEGSKTISYFATDNAGNTETAKTFTVKLDKTAPQVTPGDVVSNDWRSEPLSQQFTASDGRSGLANAADASFTLTASEESASSTQPTVVSRSVSDVAGNSTTRKVSALIDASAPTLDTDNSDGTDGITPDNGQTGVSRTVSPTATFSDEMDPASLGTSIKLYRWNAQKKVWLSVPATVSVQGKKATLDPYGATEGTTEQPLAANTRHKVSVSTGATNLAGLSMASPKSWTFTTR